MTINIDEHVEHFQYRVVQDALTQALSAYWTRRAQTFENALPRLGDFPGAADPEALERHTERLEAKVRACRSHARLMLGGDLG